MLISKNNSMNFTEQNVEVFCQEHWHRLLILWKVSEKKKGEMERRRTKGWK